MVPKTLEQAAGTKPLVVVFDDIHHGEETFLDLIEHVALLSAGEPILLLCMARPELTERRPSWPVGLQLEPLSDEQMEELTKPASLALRPQIVRAARQPAVRVRDAQGTGAFRVPPTLQALLAARLDELEPAERRVLESGAVEGETFHRSAVQALAPIRPSSPIISPHLSARGSSGRTSPRYRGRMRFASATCSSATPPTRRFRKPCEQTCTSASRAGSEIAAAHSSSSTTFSATTSSRRCATATSSACRRTSSGGTRPGITWSAWRTAFAREDHVAAISMLERAVALRPEPPDVGLELELVHALVAGGRYVDALSRADALAKRAGAVGNVVGELGARIKAGGLRIHLVAGRRDRRARDATEHALPQLDAAGDDGLLCHAYESLGGVWNMRMHNDRAGEAYDRAAAHAARAGLPYSFIGWRSLLRLTARGRSLVGLPGRKNRRTSGTVGSVSTTLTRSPCWAESTRRGRSSPACRQTSPTAERPQGRLGSV